MTSVEVPYSIACVLPSLVVVDVTNEIAHQVARAETPSGIAFVTAGEGGLLRVNERESGFFADVRALLERLVPLDVEGREHLLAFLLGARTEQVPFADGELCLGRWLLAYTLTAGIYLVQTDTESVAAGHWPLMSPWLHTSALSVFAVLSVLVALLYGAVSRWLADYERYAEQTAAAARSLLRLARASVNSHARSDCDPPRRLFGLSFESRPPPVTA